MVNIAMQMVFLGNTRNQELNVEVLFSHIIVNLICDICLVNIPVSYHITQKIIILVSRD